MAAERALHRGWELAFARDAQGAAATARDPQELAALALEWLPALVPGTAASSLRALGRWSLDEARDFDAEEIWYRLRFSADARAGAALRFEGLATLAEVWLNGARLLRAENMFTAWRVPAGEHLRAENELLLRFAPLRAALAVKRPRPRWKTRLVETQQLRWIRTTLLGRIPGWTPPCAPVGPWRGIFLEEGRAKPRVELASALEGDDGVVRARVALEGEQGEITAVRLRVGEQQIALTAERALGAGAAAAQPGASTAGTGEAQPTVRFSGELRLAEVPRWWPHTHGAQPLFPVRLAIARAGETEEILECGSVGFRALELDRAGGNFALRLNGAPIFCRGACWTPLDPVSLQSDPGALRAALEQARAAGMNMLRVGGTMVYEEPAFHALCDELGILVFQDVQLANLDYPEGDAAFLASLREEVEQLLARTRLSPSLALLCGGSEVEQQAAMLGVAVDLAGGLIYGGLLPELCARLRPDVPYVANSPTGGPLPFTVSEGLAHYYGVGAYLRPLEDARRAEVRFASECLAFANVPAAATLELLGARALPGSPRWKERVPRDSGVAWDFDDVRDHYLKLLFAEEPAALRALDPARYLQLSRAVTGEVMEAAFLEWRRGRSSCNGALIWFLRDLWPGAGFGVVDALGRPKAAWWSLRRALQPIGLALADEGASGLRLHVFNERPEPLRGQVRLALYRDGEQVIARGEAKIAVAARGELELWGDALLGRFTDSTACYRFGPPAHTLAVASLRDEAGALLGQAFYFPLGRRFAREAALGLAARVIRAEGGWALSVRSRRFAQAVALEVEGAAPADDWFHLEPGVERTIALLGAGEAEPRVWLEPLNAAAPLRAAGAETGG